MSYKTSAYLKQSKLCYNGFFGQSLLMRLIFCVLFCTLTACTQNTPSYQKIQGQTMGTSYHITFETPQGVDKIAIQTAVDARLAAINQSMSTYIDDSTISKFNRLPAGDSISIDPDFVKVLTDSRIVHQDSQGSFDPTVMPLVNLWGFGAKMTVDRLNAPPTEAEIFAVRPLIGLPNVLLTGNQLSKTKEGVSLDFSAIAKGYGVDVIAQTLEQNGIKNYMIEIGGEIATLGVNNKGTLWHIAIDSPDDGSTTKNRTILTTLLLNNAHMATSGNYRNHLQWNGVSYSHTLNPHTAYPVADGSPSVTVLHDSTALADAWATALTAIPQTDAITLANNKHIKALFVQKAADGRWQTIETPAMTQYRQSVAAPTP